jgi:DNA mismatch endonuclease (patch repair protein)
MSDPKTSGERSAIMRAVGRRNTGPELVVRQMLYANGWRYRVHRKDLPGSPDIAFPGRRKAVFVHGCFWHGHDCPKGRLPKTRTEFWSEKINRNKARDGRAEAALLKLGWLVIAIWQCELKDRSGVLRKLEIFLNEPLPKA